MDRQSSFYENGGLNDGDYYNNGYTPQEQHTVPPSPLSDEDEHDRYYQSDTQYYNKNEPPYPNPPPVMGKEPPRRTFSTTYTDGHLGNISPDLKKNVTGKSKRRRPSLQPQHRAKDRERALSGAPVGALIERVISQEGENKEARRLLKDAMARLHAFEKRAMKAEQEKRDLELVQAKQGLKVVEKVLGVQDELAKARQDAVVYKAQLDVAEVEIHRARRNTRNVQEDLDDAERAVQEARATARRLHEENLTMLARDEGRRQGFDEGMARARDEVVDERTRRRITTRPPETPLGIGGAFIEEIDDEDGGGEQTDVQGRSSRRRRGPHSTAPTPRSQSSRTIPPTPQIDPNVLRQETEAAAAARREAQRLEAQLKSEREEAASERERMRIRQQEFDREQEAIRRRERAREDALKNEADALREALRREKEKREEKERELERKQEQERHQEQIRELERQHAREREEERKRLAERERERERVEAERERQREAEREREREAERERQRQAEREQREREAQQQRERERDTASNSNSTSTSHGRPPGTIPYMAMPPPPQRILPRPPGQPSNRFSMSQSEPPPLVVPNIQIQPPPQPPPGQIAEQPKQIQPNPYPNGYPRRSALRQTSVQAQPAPQVEPPAQEPAVPQVQAQPPRATQSNSNGYPRRSAPGQPSAQGLPPLPVPRSGSDFYTRRHHRRSSTDTADTLQSTDTLQTQDTLVTPPPRNHRRRNSSPDTLDTLQSPSSASGMSSFDIVSFPNLADHRRERDQLSVIPEGSSIRSGSLSRNSEAHSPAWAANPAAWAANPPVDYSRHQNVEQWRNSSSNSAPPESPVMPDSARDFLSPSFQPRGQDSQMNDVHRRASVQSTEYEIRVEPPSGPPSDSGAQEQEQDRPEFLSPNSARVPLPQAPATPTQPPVIPPGVHGLPPNFVPQNFTSSRGGTPAPARPTMPQQNLGSGIYSNYTSPYIQPDSGPSGPPVIPPQYQQTPSQSGSQLGSIYAGVPASGSSSSSSAGRGYPSAPTSQPQRQIYAAHTPPAPGMGMMPNSIYSSNAPAPRAGSGTGMHTPHQIYSAPTQPGLHQGPAWPPGSRSSGEDVTVPFIPPSPRAIPVPPNMTPRVIPPPIPRGSSTPASFSQPLPGGGEDEDDGEDITPETRRNTQANARLRDSMGPLPIPPPSWNI